MDFTNLLDEFSENEKEHMKYIAFLFPCCFVVQYLFNNSFKDMNTFVQCIFAVATSIFAYSAFATGVIFVSAASGNREYLKFKAFNECILSIILLVIVGLIFKFDIWSLYGFCAFITIVYVVRIKKITNLVAQKKASDEKPKSASNECCDN